MVLHPLRPNHGPSACRAVPSPTHATTQYNRFKKHGRSIMHLAIAQSYVVFGVVFTIFARAQTWPCRDQWYIALFGRALSHETGSALGMTLTAVLAVGFTGLVYFGYAREQKIARRRAGRRAARRAAALTAYANDVALQPLPRVRVVPPDGGVLAPPAAHQRQRSGSGSSAQYSPSTSDGGRQRSGSSAQYSPSTPDGRHQRSGSLAQYPPSMSDADADVEGGGGDGGPPPAPGFTVALEGRVFLTSVAIGVVTALAIANTELLRQKNDVGGRTADTGQSWSFGQVLAVALAVLPGWRTAKAFWELRLGPRPPARRKQRLQLRQRPGAGGGHGGGQGGGRTSALPRGPAIIGRVLGLTPPAAGVHAPAPAVPPPSDYDSEDSSASEDEGAPPASSAPKLRLRHVGDGTP
jgi:hypothetical protein